MTSEYWKFATIVNGLYTRIFFKREAEEVKYAFSENFFVALSFSAFGIYHLTDISLKFQHDGEMYDEFGDLKKKYHVKTNQTVTTLAVAGGRALLEVEVIGKFCLTSTHISLCKELVTKGVSFRIEP